MNELALFAGAGLGLVGTHHLLGWRAVGYVEMAEYQCKVLEARIKDGLLSKAPIFCMHTSRFIELGLAAKYRGVARVVTAGFPCQPFSYSGEMEAGDDERNGWPDTICIVRLVRPEWVFLENVPGLLAGSHGYFGVILKDLAESGYDVCWRVLSAAEMGAPHQRDRIWILAHANGLGQFRQGTGHAASNQEWHDKAHQQGWSTELYETVPGSEIVADSSIERTSTKEQPGQWNEFIGGGPVLAYPNGQRQQQPEGGISQERRWAGDGGQNVAYPNPSRWDGRAGELWAARGQQLANGSWWATEPGLGRVVDGCPNRMDRLKAIGNGQVPAVVAEVWRLLTQ